MILRQPVRRRVLATLAAVMFTASLALFTPFSAKADGSGGVLPPPPPGPSGARSLIIYSVLAIQAAL